MIVSGRHQIKIEHLRGNIEKKPAEPVFRFENPKIRIEADLSIEPFLGLDG